MFLFSAGSNNEMSVGYPPKDLFWIKILQDSFFLLTWRVLNILRASSEYSLIMSIGTVCVRINLLREISGGRRFSLENETTGLLRLYRK